MYLKYIYIVLLIQLLIRQSISLTYFLLILLLSGDPTFDLLIYLAIEHLICWSNFDKLIQLLICSFNIWIQSELNVSLAQLQPQLVYYLFLICSLHIHDCFMTCLWLVLYFFMLCSLPGHRLCITWSWLVHDHSKTSSLFDNFSMFACSWLFHILFTICLFITCPFLVHDWFFFTISSLFCKFTYSHE